MNRVWLIGNLVRDPELNVVGGDIANCRFSIAVQRRFTKDKTKTPDFFTVVCWRGLADNCGKFLKKGLRVAVAGSIQNRSYEVDGQKRYATEIIAEEVQFLSSKNDATMDQDEPEDVVDDLKPITDDGDNPF
ncbi:MAG: single-stranded DNA-binding protein [Clostridia bacterium]|nr:single-stranded DNA-binding protein [Clostridia bacterium]